VGEDHDAARGRVYGRAFGGEQVDGVGVAAAGYGVGHGEQAAIGALPGLGGRELAEERYELGFALGGEHRGGLADDAALWRGVVPVGGVIGEEAVVIVNRGDEVGAEKNVDDVEVIEDVFGFGDLIGDVGVNLRSGRDVE